MLTVLLTLLVACGGEEKKAEPVKADPPKVIAPTPPPAPPPAVASGPYTPDEFAAKAYEAAKAAGADKTAANPKAGKAEAIASGKSQYDLKCASCHGAGGDGNTPVGQALPQKPANFAYKERWEATNSGTKHWIALNGIAGTGMAPVGLTDDQAWDVLAYIESQFAPK